ncbi:polysaccharide deacetylase family protein [Vibrio sp.]|nr:polysaccharide deacetylase family protein [Vibrio sp.]
MKNKEKFIYAGIALLGFSLLHAEEPEEKYTYSSDQGVLFHHQGKEIYLSKDTVIIHSDNSTRMATLTPYRNGVLTYIFDDGYRSHYDTVAPLFEKHDARAGFAIFSKVLGSTKFLSKDELRDLEKRGHELLNHSLTHKDIRDGSASQSEASEDILGGKQALEDIGLSVSTFIAPFSKTPDQYLQLVKDNHSNAYTSYSPNMEKNGQFTPELIHWRKHQDLFKLQRFPVEKHDAKTAIQVLESAAKHNAIVSFYDHDIDKSKTSSKDLSDILSKANELNMVITTPTRAANLYKSKQSSTCDFHSIEKQDSITITCGVTHNQQIEDTLTQGSLLPLEDFNSDYIIIKNNRLRVQVKECMGEKPYSALYTGVLFSKINDQCSVYLAQHSSGLVSTIVTDNRIFVSQH